MIEANGFVMNSKLIIGIVLLLCVTIGGSAWFIVNALKEPLPYCSELFSDDEPGVESKRSQAFLDGRCRGDETGKSVDEI
jgi:hypothetical protein